jgi:hypothetical protein
MKRFGNEQCTSSDEICDVLSRKFHVKEEKSIISKTFTSSVANINETSPDKAATYQSEISKASFLLPSALLHLWISSIVKFWNEHTTFRELVLLPSSGKAPTQLRPIEANPSLRPLWVKLIRNCNQPLLWDPTAQVLIPAAGSTTSSRNVVFLSQNVTMDVVQGISDAECNTALFKPLTVTLLLCSYQTLVFLCSHPTRTT